MVDAVSVPSPEQIVRQVFEARADGDVRRLAALMDPDVVARWAPGHEVARGVVAARQLLGREVVGDRRLQIDAHRITAEADDTVLVAGRIRILARDGLSDSPALWRFHVRRGRVAHVAPVGAERRLRKAA